MKGTNIVHCKVCGAPVIPQPKSSQAKSWERAVEKANRRAPMEEKSISDIVEEIKTDMCDNY